MTHRGCSCIIEFIKRVWEKISNDDLPSILLVFPNELNSIIQEHECKIIFI